MNKNKTPTEQRCATQQAEACRVTSTKVKHGTATKGSTSIKTAAAPAATVKPKDGNATDSNTGNTTDDSVSNATDGNAGNATDDNTGNATDGKASTKASDPKRPRPKANAKASARAKAPQPEGWNLGVWAKDLLTELSPLVSDEDAILLKSQAEIVDRPTAPTAAAPPDPTKPTVVRTQAALKDVAKKVAAAADVVVDLETRGLDPRKGEIVGIGLALPEGPFYIPISHRFEENGGLRPCQLPLVDVLMALRLQEKHLIGHNAKYESKWLKHYGNFRCRFVWDTMIAARLLHSDLPADLKTVASRELDVPDWGLSKAEITQVAFLPIEAVAAYCAKDCCYTLMLYRRQLACLV